MRSPSQPHDLGGVRRPTSLVHPVASPSVCGRFVSTSSASDLADWFAASPPPDVDLGERWNVAPTDDVWAVRAEDGERRLEALRWGLVPWWAEDPEVGARMINARAETVATKGAFRAAFAARRVLVPADGFYEWGPAPTSGRRKQAWYVHHPDGEPYAFAGLWESWRDRRTRGGDHGDRLRSTTIITTHANDRMAEVHERMPVILPRSAWDEWLDPDGDDTEALARLLVPAPDEVTALRPVGPEVGNVRNDGPGLVAPVEPGTGADDTAPLPGLAP